VKIALILKGDISDRRKFSRELIELEKAFPSPGVTLLESDHAGHAVELAARACGEFDYLIAVGGDGTLHEILNGCMQARQASAGLDLPVLGVLAHGSANDFVRSIGLEGSAEELTSLIRSRAGRRIDAGSVTCENSAGESLEHYFLNVADVGIGASVVERLRKRQTFLGSDLNYLKAIVATFLTYRQMELHVASDEGLDWQGRALALVAANGCYFGSGLCVAPGATLDDGKLFLTLIGDASIVDFMMNLGRLKRGIPLDHPAAQYHQAGSVRVISPGRPAPVEADGEFLGYTPAAIVSVPGAVTFLAP
jgi:YegS/Rv2252/BmrU family lipid kinase